MTVPLPSLQPAPLVAASSSLASAQPSVPYIAAERVAPEPRGRPVVVAIRTPAPTEEPPPPTPAPLPVAARAPVVAAPAACPSNFLCYPRLGIAGAIVPYSDCSGATDVGTAIRQLTCVSQGVWLAGHAYTEFGRITDFRIGDIVFVRGQRFEITGSSVQRACAPATGAIAPLSLQTSLESAACGRVLVVQGR